MVQFLQSVQVCGLYAKTTVLLMLDTGSCGYSAVGDSNVVDNPKLREVFSGVFGVMCELLTCASLVINSVLYAAEVFSSTWSSVSNIDEESVGGSGDTDPLDEEEVVHIWGLPTMLMCCLARICRQMALRRISFQYIAMVLSSF